MKNENGMTLIAIVITVIVLLILAAVSISMVIGENGVLTNASTVSQNQRYTEADERATSIAGAAAIEQSFGSSFQESILTVMDEYEDFDLLSCDGSKAVIKEKETKREYEIDLHFDVKYIGE